jgi:DNA replication licensing factor MCM2
MSEAHAKMHMRTEVRDDDVNVSISVMLHSFMMAQKFSVRNALQRGFRRYLTEARDFHALLMNELQKLMRDAEIYERLRTGKPADRYAVWS